MTKLFSLLEPRYQKLFHPTTGDGTLKPGEICRYRLKHGAFQVGEDRMAHQGLVRDSWLLYPTEFYIKVEKANTEAELADLTGQAYQVIIQNLIDTVGETFKPQLFQRVRCDFRPEYMERNHMGDNCWFFCSPIVSLVALPAEDVVRMDTFKRVD